MRRTVVALLFVAASWVPGATQQPVEIQVRAGFGTVIRLDRSFQNGTIHVGNPSIADVKPARTSDRVLLLSAAKAGQTSLFILDNKGEEIYRAVVNVTEQMPPGVPGGGVNVHGLAGSTSGSSGGYIHGYTEYVCNPICSVTGTVDPKRLKPARPDLNERFINPNNQEQQNVDVSVQGGGPTPPAGGVRGPPPQQ